MPTKKREPSKDRLSQRWPESLLKKIDEAAAAKGWTTTAWLQEAAKIQLNKKKRKSGDENREIEAE